MIYIVALLISMLLALCAMKAEKGSIRVGDRNANSHIFAFLSFVPLTLLMAFRCGVGMDYWTYYRIYMGNEVRVSIEPVFTLLISVLQKISSNPMTFFIVTSVMICSMYYRGIYKYSVNPCLSILMFVINMDYFCSMNVVRQYIAVVILLFAIPYIIKGDFKRFIIIVAIATAVHATSIIYILLYVFYRVKLTPIKAIGLAGAEVALIGVINRLLLPFINRFTVFGIYYTEVSKYSEANFSWYYFLIYASFFAIMMIKQKDIKENNNLQVMFSAVVVGLIAVLAGLKLPFLITRILWFTNPIIAIFLPEFASTFKNKYIKYAVLAAVIILYATITGRDIANGRLRVYPYTTYWDNYKIW